MPAIGDVKINLIADAAKVVSGSAAGEKALTGFAGRVKGFASSAMGYFGKVGSALSSVKGAVVAAAAAVGAYKLAGSLNAAAESADKLGKKAKTLGVGVEALSALKFAAEEAGVDFDTLSKMLSKSQRTIVGAMKTGTGEAAAAFHKLGFSVGEVGEMLQDPVRILPQLARAFEKIQTQGEKLDLAESIFGKGGGEEFVMFLEDSGGFMENLVDQTERAKRLGAIITPEQVARLTQYNDAVGRIRVAWEGIATNVMARVAPALSRFADNFAEALARVRKTTGNFLSLAIRAFTSNENGEREVLYTALKMIFTGAFDYAWAAVKRRLATYWQFIVEFVSGLAPEVGFLMEKLMGGLVAAGGFIGQMISAAWEKVKEAWPAIKDVLVRMGQYTADAWDRAEESLSGYYETLDSEQAKAGAKIGSAIGLVNRWAEKYDNLGEAAAAANAKIQDGLSRTNDKTEGFFDGFKRRIKELTDNAKDFGSVGVSVADEVTTGLSSGLAGALIQVKAGFRNLGREALAVLQRVGEAIAQTILQALIMRAVTGIANSVIGGNGTSGLNYNPAYSLPAGIQGAVPARASGGPVRAGGLYLVGEHGPELMKTQSAGRVYNARDTRSMLSGGDVSVQVIDQRGSGQRPQVSQSNGPDGRKQLRILIRDEMAAAHSDGSMDKVMGTNYGVGRRSVTR